MSRNVREDLAARSALVLVAAGTGALTTGQMFWLLVGMALAAIVLVIWLLSSDNPTIDSKRVRTGRRPLRDKRRTARAKHVDKR